MNDYEYSEIESEDHYCENCGKLISTDEYIEGGICSDCLEDCLEK